jgi:hypothetical protein
MTDRTLELNLAQAAQDFADYLKANELTTENYQAVQSLFHSVCWMGEAALKLAIRSVDPSSSEPEVVAVIAETSGVFPETEVIHGAGIDSLPIGTELVDRAHVTRLQAEIQRLNSIIEQQKK